MEDFGKFKKVKNLAMAMGAYTGASILGPLLIIGGAGYFLDKQFGTKPILTIVGVFIAFIFSNILLYKKAMYLTGYINGKYNQEKKEEEEKK